jgi:hypothetical protein
MGKVHCAYGSKLAGLFRAGPATWAGGPSQRKQGSRERLAHDRWAATVVGDSSKPAPEMGGKKVLWQGGSVVDRFEGQGHQKLTERSSLR